jgi:glyoxylase-like metal-dependent hydrolase (beta-lactamase superfamily II)
VKTILPRFCLSLLMAGVLPALPVEAVQSSVSVTRALRHWNPSEELAINEVAEGVFVANHKTPIPSNSLIVFGRDGSCLLVDTPWTPDATETLLGWVEDSMGAPPPTMAVTTHFHLDRLGGNSVLAKRGIPVYGGDLSVALLKEKGEAYVQGGMDVPVVPPDHVFPAAEGLTLELDGEPVVVWYPGPGHTKDNLVVYLPKRRVLFGGCLVKSLEATDLGYTKDADLAHWADSLAKLRARFPEALVVVPGHGRSGGFGLIEHTLELLGQ